MPTERQSRPRYFVATDLQSLGTSVPREFMVFPYGRFQNGGWPEPVTIDRAFGDEMARNFAANVTQVGVPMDVEHQRGPAPGWITAVEARDDGIWVTCDWTDYGRELVESRQYRFCSPEFWAEWTRPVDGAAFRNLLTRVSLTNAPFFSQMPALIATAELRAEGPRILGGFSMPVPEDSTQVSGAAGMAGAQQQAAGGPPAAHTSGQVAAHTAGQGERHLTPQDAPRPVSPSLSEGGTAGQAAAATAAAPGTDAGALQAELTNRDTRIAELQASMAAMQAREARTALVAELQSRTSATNPRARLAPAQAEAIADILLCVPETALTATAANGTQSQTTRRRQAADALWSIIEAGIPELGERGGGMQPAMKAETAEEKSAELHRLASAKRTAQADMSYEAACRAVLAERPELAG